MVCHTTLLKRVKIAKMVNARMGVSMTAADAEGIEELKKENIVLPVHNKRGIRCVWMFTEQDEPSATTGHSEWKEHIQVSLCRAKIEATITGHLLRGMKLGGHVPISDCPDVHVRNEPISVGDKGVIPPFRREFTIRDEFGPVHRTFDRACNLCGSSP
jgi:hypothetical protein